jgi:hypothetical protein
MNKTGIKYLLHDSIDKLRWDAALACSSNARVYARAAFLDAMCPGWDALVLGDYEAMLPLPWRRKAGISYLYHPFLTAQLGLFSPDPNKELLSVFLQSIPNKFKYIDLPLNAANDFSDTGFLLSRRANYVLDLTPTYEVIQSGYRENVRRNIKRAIRAGCTAASSVSFEEICALAKPYARDEAGLRAFGKLVSDWQPQGHASLNGVRDPSGDLLASAVFLLDDHRAYYLLVGNHPNGRTLGASHMLIDSFIQHHAGKELILDFEGSDIQNLAFYYESFGAKPEPYPMLRLNRLPWYMRWLKS